MPVQATTAQGPLAAPSHLSATGIMATQVTLTWTDNSGNETGFEILKAESAGNYTLVTPTAANVTSYIATGLTEGASYSFKVVAVKGAERAESNIATVTTPHVPLAPVLGSATPKSSTEIQVAWQDVSNHEDGFQVLAGDTVPATTLANTTTVTVAGLKPSSEYVVTVRAYNVAGWSSSGGITVKSLAAPPVDSYATGETLVLGTLAGSWGNTFAKDSIYEQLTEKLTGGKTTRTSGLEHKWTFNLPPGGSSVFYAAAHWGVSTDAEQFVFAYSTDNVIFYDMVLATEPSGYVTYELPGSVQGTTYIRVKDSNRSPNATALDTLYVDHMVIRTDVSAPPSTPTQVVVIAGNTTASLSWAAVVGTVKVYRRTSGSTSFEVIASEVTGTTWQDSGLVNGTTYEYTLTAVNEFGERATSQIVAATPKAATLPPTNLAATGGRKKITLTWAQSTSPGVTGNKIYRYDGTTWILIATNPPNTTYLDVVPTGTTYSYRVTAVGPLGESTASNTATATAK